MYFFFLVDSQTGRINLVGKSKRETLAPSSSLTLSKALNQASYCETSNCGCTGWLPDMNMCNWVSVITSFLKKRAWL